MRIIFRILASLMNDIVLAFFLAVIQGITEFLPISSSAHLLLPSLLLGTKDLGLEFDIAVHAGTLCAVIYFFWGDLKQYAVSVLNVSEKDNPNKKVAINLIIATIPIVLIGGFFNDLISQRLITKEIIAFSNIIFASLLLGSFYFSKSTTKKHQNIFQLTMLMSFLIGCIQIFALIPGASRSGVVIMAGLFLGLNLRDASKFSFLLAIPTILGALVFLIGDSIASNFSLFRFELVLGFVISGLVAFFTIKYFLKFVEIVGLIPFFIYRMLLGVLLILL